MYTSRSLLQFFCFITFIVYCVAVRLPNYSTDLGITLNEITKTDGPIAECIVYTSLVEYEDDVSKFTDAQIGGLARQAWEEMIAAHDAWANSCSGDKQQYIKDRRPFMMSAIAIGKEIFFASSITSNAVNIILQNENAALTQALNACRINYYPNAEKVDSDQIHRAKGSCGEIMASAMFLQAHKALPWSDAKVKARAVALGAQKGTLQNACSRADKTEGGQPRISCLNWVNWTGLEMIAKKTKIEAVTVMPKKVTNLSLKDVWKIVPTADFKMQA